MTFLSTYIKLLKSIKVINHETWLELLLLLPASPCTGKQHRAGAQQTLCWILEPCTHHLPLTGGFARHCSAPATPAATLPLKPSQQALSGPALRLHFLHGSWRTVCPRCVPTSGTSPQGRPGRARKGWFLQDSGVLSPSPLSML